MTSTIDPVAYVRQTAPFDALPQALFDEAARSLEVSYHPAGTWLVRAGGEPLQHLYLIRKGSVRLERDGQILQVLEEGETFGYTSLITRKATLDAVVEDDLLAYRLPDAEFQRLLGDGRFAAHFAHGLSERLKASLEHSPVATFQVNLSVEVQQLVRRPAVWVGPEASVGDAAKVMSREGISSVLVRTEPPGIVTDRDFRRRVLAEGLGPEAKVTQVYSSPLRTVPANTPLYLAWEALLDAGTHHLPVTRDGDVAGVLTSTDLLKHTAQGPMAVLRRVERLANRDSLPGYAAKVAEMAAALLAGGLDVTVIAGFVARLNDALLRRVLHFAHAEMGPAPAPYAWLVFGSEARMEQTLLTDQDNALVYADEGGDRKDWWQAFAERVVADLEAAGFAHCPGEHTARRLNNTLSEWVKSFGECIDAPKPKEAALLFDFRRVSGDLGVGPLEAVCGRAARNPLFLRFLAQSALQFQPPATLMMRLQGGSSTVDLKAHALAPIVFLARCYGLEVGTRARGTLERLDAARDAGLMGEDAWSSITQAFRFALGLRLRLQLRLLSEGQAPANAVHFSDLSAIERTSLKDAFRAIKAWQEKAAYHYQVEFL
jgi:CBS domain-containing protein